MLKIVAIMKIKEGKVNEFKSLAKELVEKSAAEDGNLSYSLNEVIGDTSSLAFIEIWKDEAAFEEHKSSEHFTSIFPKLSELCDNSQPAYMFTEVEY